MWLIRLIIVLSILWVIAAFIGWMIRRAFFRQIEKARESMQPKQQANHEKALVACEQCGTFIDKDKAISHKGKRFCSENHLTEYKKDM